MMGVVWAVLFAQLILLQIFLHVVSLEASWVQLLCHSVACGMSPRDRIQQEISFIIQQDCVGSHISGDGGRHLRHMCAVLNMLCFLKGNILQCQEDVRDVLLIGKWKYVGRLTRRRLREGTQDLGSKFLGLNPTEMNTYKKYSVSYD